MTEFARFGETAGRHAVDGYAAVPPARLPEGMSSAPATASYRPDSLGIPAVRGPEAASYQRDSFGIPAVGEPARASYQPDSLGIPAAGDPQVASHPGGVMNPGGVINSGPATGPEVPINPGLAVNTGGAVVTPAKDVDRLLATMVERGGSDLHITVGIEPCIRIDGELEPLTTESPLGPADTERLIRSVLTEEQWARFEKDNELDLAYAIPRVSRFRVNIYRQRGSVGAAFRGIPHTIRSLAELGVPDAVERFSQLPRGLVLVTGPTGSGKSTTLASLLDVANKTRSGHIVTIEDPIEYLHKHGTCVVNQREVGSDTSDFATALKHVLRQDPDIILVGELRDLETTSVAITAAETGHLVLATLHTKSAAQTIDRLIDIYPHSQQQQIRAQLANALEGVVAQSLLPRPNGGRVVVCELMISTPAIRSLIREDKVHLIPSYVQSGSDVGMVSFDQHLAQRFHDGMVAKHVALDMAQDQGEFRRLAGLAI